MPVFTGTVYRALIKDPISGLNRWGIAEMTSLTPRARILSLLLDQDGWIFGATVIPSRPAAEEAVAAAREEDSDLARLRSAWWADEAIKEQSILDKIKKEAKRIANQVDREMERAVGRAGEVFDHAISRVEPEVSRITTQVGAVLNAEVNRSSSSDEALKNAGVGSDVRRFLGFKKR